MSCPTVRPALVSLLLACSAAAASAQDSTAPVAKPAADPTPPSSSYAVPALEIVGFDFLLNRFNHVYSGTTDYDVTWSSIKRNLRGPWVVDDDPFRTNQFGHPYQGAMYHGAARATGHGYWESSAVTFLGSVAWEIAGEQTPPAKNDQIASGIAGSFFGESLFRMAHLALKPGGSVPAGWRDWVAGAISPPVALNRGLFGSKYDDAFDDHDPAYYGRLHLGGGFVTVHPPDTLGAFKTGMAQADFALDYGLPGQPGYTYNRPFDYFNFQATLNSANGMENISTHGMLMGTDFAAGNDYRGIWGIFGSYDYLSPQIFHVSTTALSLGTAGQWWVSKTIALQGFGLAGLGYSAASTTNNRQLTNDSEYHYGVAPRVALSLRTIFGDRASLDFAAREVSLGRIANRNAGSDDIARVDTAFTWRLWGQHAIGISYIWDYRNAQYAALDARHQRLGTVGIYYTLLSHQGFGAVDWRDTTGH